jgi:hypothetical protein
VGEKLQENDARVVAQWLGLATIEQAQGGGMVYVRGHCTEQERDAAQYWRGVSCSSSSVFSSN